MTMDGTNMSRCDFLMINSKFPVSYIGIPFSCFVICQNIVIIITIWRTQALHTNANIYIASVAINDVLMGLIWIFFGYLHVHPVQFSNSDILIIDSFMLGASYASVLSTCTHMVVIAIDRYIHITYPFYYMKNMTQEHIIKLLLCTWIVWLVSLLIPLLVYRDEKYHQICVTLKPPLGYFTYATVLSVIYNIIICFCYFQIAMVAFQHKKAAITRRLQSENIETVIRIKQKTRATMRSVKFFIIMFGTFFLCTLPQGLIVWMNYLSVQISEDIVFTFMYLYEIYSVINFFIYIHMNKDFSKGMCNLIKCSCQCKNTN